MKLVLTLVIRDEEDMPTNFGGSRMTARLSKLLSRCPSQCRLLAQDDIISLPDLVKTAPASCHR